MEPKNMQREDLGHGRDRPDFGPGGYLPERAAKRARKIVLRQPMGLQWPIAAGVAALLLIVIGVLYLTLRATPPGEPFMEAGRIDAVDPRGSAILSLPGDGGDVLVVRGGGGVQVFDAPPVEAAWCPASRRIESSAGQVWRIDGQLAGGSGASLEPLAAQVYDGVLYVDPARQLPSRAEDPSGASPECAVPAGPDQ